MLTLQCIETPHSTCLDPLLSAGKPSQPVKDTAEPSTHPSPPLLTRKVCVDCITHAILAATVKRRAAPHQRADHAIQQLWPRLLSQHAECGASSAVRCLSGVPACATTTLTKRSHRHGMQSRPLQGVKHGPVKPGICVCKGHHTVVQGGRRQARSKPNAMLNQTQVLKL